MVEDGGREKENDKGKTNQEDRVVEVHFFPVAVSRKVEPEEYSKQGKEDARELGKLFPVQVVPCVELENKGIVDLVMCPHTAGQSKQGEQQKHQKIAPVDLHQVARSLAEDSIRVEQ